MRASFCSPNESRNPAAHTRKHTHAPARAQNDITDVLADLTFTAESDFFGRKEQRELVPGGKDIRVTEANKREYVDLIARHHMTTSIKNQIKAVLQGFWELVPRCGAAGVQGGGGRGGGAEAGEVCGVLQSEPQGAFCGGGRGACRGVPTGVHHGGRRLCQRHAQGMPSTSLPPTPGCPPRRNLISIFNDHELELLISGLPDIDVADLRANTEYQGYNPNTPVVRCAARLGGHGWGGLRRLGCRDGRKRGWICKLLRWQCGTAVWLCGVDILFAGQLP